MMGKWTGYGHTPECERSLFDIGLALVVSAQRAWAQLETRIWNSVQGLQLICRIEMQDGSCCTTNFIVEKQQEFEFPTIYVNTNTIWAPW